MAPDSQDLQAGFRIGDCLIEPRQNRIVREGREARLEPRVMDVLVSLARRAGEVVSRDTLNAEVWGNVVVTDQAVTNCISELRQHLGDDRAAHRIIETIPKRGYRLVAPVLLASADATSSVKLLPTADGAVSEPPTTIAPRVSPRGIWIGTAAALGVLGIGFLAWTQRATTPHLGSVALARFENAAGDASLDYLAFAIPDEITTLLSKSRELAVRPQIDSRDPVAAARALAVGHVVTGRYYLEKDGRLGLAIEAQDVAQKRIEWRTQLTVPPDDVLALRAQLADAVRKGLAPALGARVAATGNAPLNAEAYQIYLRSIALPQQPNQTERAIELLEKAVALEPDFAPAWQALGLRYYERGTWFTTDSVARQQSLAAHRKALELDPQLLAAARNIVTRRAESGDLEGAYRDARQLLEQFGPGIETYFALSYVYRFGGMLEEANARCERALTLDAQDPRLRSCAYSNLYAGNLARVLPYLMLDEGTFFSQWGTVLYQLRRNDRQAALDVARQAADEPTRRLMLPCLEGVRGAALDAAVDEFVEHWERSGDPEAAYAIAPMLLWCGRKTEALRFVERSINLGFCPFPALDADGIWHAVRDDPEFLRIRTRAVDCHDAFRRVVESFGPPS